MYQDWSFSTYSAQTWMCILFAGSNGYVDGWLHQHTLIVFPLSYGVLFFPILAKAWIFSANNKSLEKNIKSYLFFTLLETWNKHLVWIWTLTVTVQRISMTIFNKNKTFMWETFTFEFYVRQKTLLGLNWIK